MPVAILRLSLAGGVMKVVTTANELLTVDVSYIGLHGVGCGLIPPQSPRPSYYTRPPTSFFPSAVHQRRNIIFVYNNHAIHP